MFHHASPADSGTDTPSAPSGLGQVSGTGTPPKPRSAAPKPPQAPLALTPDRAEAEHFLTLLDETAERFTFQTFSDQKPAPNPDPLAKTKSGTLAQCFNWLAGMNAKGAGIFVTVNETDGKGRKRENITRIRAVWQECDHGDEPPLPAEPHVEVESSPGRFHRYLLVDGMPLDQFEPTQLRLVDDFRSDPNAKDRARVLRLPGFFHLKDPSRPHRVQIVHESGRQPLAWPELQKLFPAASRPAPGHDQPQPGRVEISPETKRELRSALNAIPSDDYGTWIQIGHALHELGDFGRGLWLDWSQGSDKWRPEHAQKWRTFTGDRTSYQAVFAEAQRRGWVNPLAKPKPASQDADGEDTGPLLRHVSLENFTALRPKAPEFVIGPFIPRGFVTLLGGHGEIGKSMLALTLAAHVAVGRDWADLPITQGKVRYISLEDDGELVLYRLQRIAEAYSLDTDAMSANLSIIDASDAGPLAQEVNVFGAKGLTMTPLAAEVEALAAGYDLVILDNASDAFDGDENSRRQVRTFIKSLAKWVKGHRGAVLLLAHIDKAAARFGANGNSYSGSTAWHNSARSRLALARNPKTDAIELAHEKLNVGRKLEDPIVLDWNEGGVLLPISANVRQSIEALAEVSFDQDVYALVRAAIAAEMTVTTATTGPVTAWHTLQPLPEFPAQLKPRSAKPRFEAALIRLSRKGMIRREKYTKDYKARERWVL